MFKDIFREREGCRIDNDVWEGGLDGEFESIGNEESLQWSLKFVPFVSRNWKISTWKITPFTF